MARATISGDPATRIALAKAPHEHERARAERREARKEAREHAMTRPATARPADTSRMAAPKQP